ncbi:MAG: hypothetical protein ACOC14_02415 [Bacillota bacterium]
MHKETYLSSIKDTLDCFDVSEEEKASILKDYEAKIENLLKKGHTPSDLERLLGDQKQIKKHLETIYPKKKTIKRIDAVNRTMPYITLALFVLLGVIYDAWHPGWMVFLLIPLTTLLLDLIQTETIRTLNALLPVTSLVLFLTLGFFYDLWHPGWVVLTLGIMGILLMNRGMTLLQKMIAIAPFVALDLFVLIGYFTGVYVPTWTVFLLVIAVGILNVKAIHHKWLLEGLLVLSLGVYLLIGYGLQEWTLALFSFLIFIVPAIFTGHIHVHIHGFATWVEKTTLLLSIIVFFLWGYFFDAWAVAWVVFFTVPSMSVILHAKGRDSLVPMTVFLSILGFYLIGYYTGQWNLAWLIFLVIPVVAIGQKL